MMPMFNKTSFLTIDKQALLYNIKLIREIAPKQKLLAMLKGNAYGHGLTIIATEIQEYVDAFGIMHISEGVYLRQNGLKNKILMLAGAHTYSDLIACAEYNLDIVIHDKEQVKLLQKVKLQSPVIVWLKINVGLNRLGFPPSEIKSIASILSKNANVKQPIKLMSHFSDSNQINNDITLTQLNYFRKIVSTFPYESSLYNSAGILSCPSTYFNWIRPGLILFGVSPFNNSIGQDHGLKPVMTFHTRLISVKKHFKGDRIGYEGTWTCPLDGLLLGIIPIGYADGYPRHLLSNTPVIVNGKKCYIVGRVSMHLSIIDLSNCLHAKVNDEVILWGKELPIELIAAQASTIPNELLVSIPQTTQRIVI